MGATYFKYNGIYIGVGGNESGPNVLPVDIVAYNNEAIYDPSQTNLMLTKTSLTVRGLVKGDPSSIRNTLMQPRQPLDFCFGDGPYSQANLPAGDQQAGPLPRRCDIVMLGGGGPLCLVTFGIDFQQITATTSPSALIQFNYGRTFSMDERFLSMITTAGSFTVNKALNADLYRSLAWFPLPDGFRRKSSNFVLSQDGLTLNFQLADEEFPGATLPKPLTAVQAHFATSMDDYNWHNHFSASGKTHKQATKLQVFTQLVAMMNSRMDFDKEIIIGGVVGENLYENECSLQVTTLIYDLKQLENGIGPGSTQLFTKVPTSKSAEVLGPYGSALLAAAKTVWYSSTIANTPNQNTGGAPGSNSTGNLTVGIYPQQQPPSGSGSGGSKLKQNPNSPYLAYKETYEWKLINGVVIAPAALQGGGVSIYQVHDPYILIHHFGHAAMAKQQPTFPIARLVNGTYMIKREQTILSPELAADHGNVEYGIMWDYELIMPLFKENMRVTGEYEDAIVSTIYGPPNPMISQKVTPYQQPGNSNIEGMGAVEGGP